ncbi:MAG TPA: MFS transporter, partial [Pyrinomonadaceae bacterium]
GSALLPFVVIMFSLSRWSGGLVDRFGSRLPLTVGPLVAALGFGLFMLPGVNSNYWTSFFPAVVVLGLGMAISVAPLTTTVMGSVDSEQAGIASGINNAVSRAAGLIAIAVFGVLMMNLFGRQLADKLNQVALSEEMRSSVESQFVQLGGMKLPAGLTQETRSAVTTAIEESFVSGFRLIMLVSAGLAVSSGLSSWLMIGKSATNSRIAKPGQRTD